MTTSRFDRDRPLYTHTLADDMRQRQASPRFPTQEEARLRLRYARIQWLNRALFALACGALVYWCRT